MSNHDEAREMTRLAAENARQAARIAQLEAELEDVRRHCDLAQIKKEEPQ